MMNKIISSWLIFGVVSLFAENWTQQFGTSSEDYGTDIVSDNSGNIYLTGYTDGSLEGNNLGNGDIWLAKFSQSGHRVWTRQFGSSNSDVSTSITVNDSGDIFIVGYTHGSINGSNIGASDVWLAKFNNNGDRIWTRQFGTVNHEYSEEIISDGNGNIYLTGRTNGSLSGGNHGDYDFWLAKFDENGQSIWKKQFGTIKHDYAKEIILDGNGDIYLTGRTHGSLNGINLGGSDIFLAKFNRDGTEIWTKQFGSSQDDDPRGMKLDYLNNIYIGGYTSGVLGEISFGGVDVFVKKFDENGTEIWTKQLGTIEGDVLNDLTVEDKNIYLTGYTRGSAYQTNQGLSDIVILKLDENGKELWTRQFGTSAGDYSNGITVIGKDIYFTGYVEESLDGNVHIGGADIFLMKFEDIIETKEALQFGDINCSFGGTKFESGVDENSNSILDTSEITETYFVCFNSPDYLERNETLMFGNKTCFYGGIEINNGLDKNKDEYLSDDEVNQTRYECISYENSSVFGNNSFLRLKEGWSLVAVDINLSKIPSVIPIIWQFAEDENWSAFSPNGEFTSQISEGGFLTILEDLTTKKGSWFLSNTDMVLKKDKIEDSSEEISPKFPSLDGETGWNLLGTDKTIPAKAVNCYSGELARVWKFVDGNWKLFVDGIDISQFPDMFDTIFANEGFWVKCK
jgi:hypothetical protein